MPRKPRASCLNCSNETQRPGYKYCTNQCQVDFQYKRYIEDWQAGSIIGLQRLGVVSRHIKRYLRDKYHNKCCLCGWSEVNVHTGIVPLVADHIDGDWQNNTEQNLRLICPNCDSLTATYAGSNRGRGRKGRGVSMRVNMARSLSSQKTTESDIIASVLPS